MFEIITSEYSYMHSLSILVGHFMRSEELKETMTQTEHHHLFSNISDILTVSTRQVGLGAGTRQAWEGTPSCLFVVQNQPSLGLLKVLPGRWGANALRDGAEQAVSVWESSRRRMQQPENGCGGVQGLWLPHGKTSWRVEVEEGSHAGMEEACASGEGVGVPAAGAALPEGIQAPSPLGKLGRSCSGNIQFVRLW